MASARFLLAGAILWIILSWTLGFHASWKQWRDNFMLSALMLLGGNGLVVWAEQQVPSGIATLVISLNPLFMVVAEWIVAGYLIRQKKGLPHPLIIAGLLLGLIGLVLLVWPAILAHDASHLDGWRIAALVMACVSWTIGSLAGRYLRDPAEPFAGAAMQMLSGGLWFGIAGLCAGEPWRYSLSDITTQSWIAWAYLVVAGSLLAFTAFLWLMQHCSPTLVSTYAYVNPIVAVFLGWLILDEPVGPRIFASAAIIILSVALITYAKQRTSGQLPAANKPASADSAEQMLQQE